MIEFEDQHKDPVIVKVNEQLDIVSKLAEMAKGEVAKLDRLLAAAQRQVDALLKECR